MLLELVLTRFIGLGPMHFVMMHCDSLSIFLWHATGATKTDNDDITSFETRFDTVFRLFFSMESEDDVFDSLRELELRLLESQVVGSTRDATKVAYAQAGEDVTRAVPLLRMATLLADRVAMVIFMMNQN